MKNTRRAGALVSGIVLYTLAILFSAVLGEIRLPREMYKLLGGRSSTAVVVGEAAAIGLLIFAFALVWAYTTLRPLRLGRRVSTAWCLSGVGLGWLGWLVYGAVYFDAYPHSTHLPISGWLLSSGTPPLWGLFNTLAVLAGTLLAGSLVRRKRSTGSRLRGTG